MLEKMAVSMKGVDKTIFIDGGEFCVSKFQT